MQKSKQEATKVVSLVKHGGKTYKSVSVSFKAEQVFRIYDGEIQRF